MSEMMKQVLQAKEELKHTARTGEGGNPDGETSELPEGSSPLEAREETSVEQEETPEETSGEGESEASAAAAAEEGETLITINGKEFKSQADAIKYAEQLENEKTAAELYNQGVRDALAAGNRPTEQAAEPEDNFEERFYANPKEELKNLKAQARDEALAAIKAEQQRENLWNTFLTANPDLRRKDAERILQENWETIGKMTDLDRAMKVLAQKTRAEYEEIREMAKPRTALKSSSAQVVSPSGGSAKGVTPQKKDDRPLDFISQMKKLKGHG